MARSLRIAVFNAGALPANFGIENVAAFVGGQPVAVVPREELERRAKTRATWSRIGTAVAVSLVAGVAAGVNTTSAHGRIGGTRYTVRGHDRGAAVLTPSVAAGAGGQALRTIQDRLDYTLDRLADDIVQTTTVDPGAAYGGRIVLAGVDDAKLPYDVAIMVSWNGRRYSFIFRATRPGVAVPPSFAGPPAPMLTAAAPVPAAMPVPPAMPRSGDARARPAVLAASTAADAYAAGRAAALAAQGDGD